MSKQAFLVMALHYIVQELQMMDTAQAGKAYQHELNPAPPVIMPAPQIAISPLLTTKEVLNYLKIGRTTLFRIVRDKLLLPVRVHKQRRFRYAEVQAVYEDRVYRGKI